jgi:hypothetical protein
MAGATEPCATRTYRVVACRVVAVLTVGAGAWLPFAKAASWGTTPVPPPPVQQPLPSQADSSQDSRMTVGRLLPGDVVSLQVIPYRE